MASTYVDLREDLDTLPGAAPSGAAVRRLNVTRPRADSDDMALKSEVEGAEEVGAGRIADIDRRLIDGTHRQAVAEDVEEMERLQQKVSLLAMQKDYWQQRSLEQAAELQTAQAELARLEALAPLAAGPAPTVST